MRYLAIILAFLTFITVATCSAASSEYIYIKDVKMLLEGENATFELNYTLDTFTHIYVMALGCRYLEPKLISFLGGYSNVKLVKADTDGAALRVSGAGKYNSGYYLFDSMPFGPKENPLKKGITSFSVVYPEGRVRTFHNVTATQNVFSHAKRILASPSMAKDKLKQG